MDTCLPWRAPPRPWFIKPRRASTASPSSFSVSVLHTVSLFFFSFFPVSLADTHAHTYRKNHHPAGPVHGRGEKWLLSSPPPFKWGSAAVSVTETPRGGHQTKGKPFTLYCPLPQRAHISFLYPSPVFFPFSHTPSIHPFLIFPSLRSPASQSIFYKVGCFDSALWGCIEGGSLSENTQRAKDSFKKESENERDSRSWGRSVSLFNFKQRIVR